VPNIRRGDRTRDALLGPGIGAHDQDGWEPGIAVRGGRRGREAVVGSEFRPQPARVHAAPIELQKEAMVVHSELQKSVAIRTESSMGTRGGASPFKQCTAAGVDACRPSNGRKHPVRPERVEQLPHQGTARAEWSRGPAAGQPMVTHRCHQWQPQLRCRRTKPDACRLQQPLPRHLSPPAASSAVISAWRGWALG
jgi:hypothetical protein